MTFVSMWLLGSDRAYIASDRELYRANLPYGQEKKLAISERSGVAGVHVGDTGGLQMLAELVTSASDFDQLVRDLPRRAREEQDFTFRHLPRHRSSAENWKFAVAGWSCVSGCVMAATLLAEDDFAPKHLMVGTGWAAPYVRGLEFLRPTCGADLADYARSQLVWLRKTVPDANADNVVDVACIHGRALVERSFEINVEATASKI